MSIAAAVITLEMKDFIMTHIQVMPIDKEQYRCCIGVVDHVYCQESSRALELLLSAPDLFGTLVLGERNQYWIQTALRY